MNAPGSKPPVPTPDPDDPPGPLPEPDPTPPSIPPTPKPGDPVPLDAAGIVDPRPLPFLPDDPLAGDNVLPVPPDQIGGG